MFIKYPGVQLPDSDAPCKKESTTSSASSSSSTSTPDALIYDRDPRSNPSDETGWDPKEPTNKHNKRLRTVRPPAPAPPGIRAATVKEVQLRPNSPLFFTSILLPLFFAVTILVAATTMAWYKNMQSFGPIAFGHSPSYSITTTKQNSIKASIVTTTIVALPTPPLTPSTSQTSLRTHSSSSTPLPPPEYSASSISRFLPFAINNQAPDAPPMSTVPYMRLSFLGEDIVAGVDTGSTGFMFSAADLKCWDSSWENKYEKGWQYLSSSRLLYVGVWVPANVSFPDAQNITDAHDIIDLTGDQDQLKKRAGGTHTTVTSNVKILVVTQKVKVPDWLPSDGPNYRPGGKNTFPAQHMPKGIRYLGIGFGRQDDGMPQSGPDKNVMLNIAYVDGRRVVQSSSYSYSTRKKKGASNRMRTGYIVTKTGIHVGLTEANSKRFRVQKLKRRPASTDGRDWSMARMCVSIDESRCVTGNLLVDTGIRQSYLTVPQNVTLRRHARKNPSSGAMSKVLDDGVSVKVDFGSAGGYGYVVGQGEDVEPTMVCTTSSDKKEPFINTGCHFLKKFDIMFDADPSKGGFFGVREGL